MQDLYEHDSYCMDFSNSEIEEYLLKPLRERMKISIHLPSGTSGNCYTEPEKIECVYLDGEAGKFMICFYGHQMSIFISDETPPPERCFTFNEEVMFIDDRAKEHIVSSDTYKNIVYEGTLRDKSHREMLELFYQVIAVLRGAESMAVEETVVSQVGWQYPKCEYKVRITNQSGISRIVRFENITFLINAGCKMSS